MSMNELMVEAAAAQMEKDLRPVLEAMAKTMVEAILATEEVEKRKAAATEAAEKQLWSEHQRRFENITQSIAQIYHDKGLR